MNESKIPVRYARALFLTGKEKKILKTLAGDITLLSEFFEKTPAVISWLRSPAISAQERKDFFREAFGNRLSETTMRFIDLVISMKRERYFMRIFRNFLQLYKDEAGIKTLILTTATEVDEVTGQRLSLMFEDKGKDKQKNELVTRVKPSIIGGFMLQIDDMLYDASVATELKQLKKELTRQLQQ
jgi:F-type H+-transporting ATPase subunit delta